MFQEQDRKQDEQPAESEDFAYSIAWGSEPDDAADLCPDCRGKGRVLLLINTVPCQTCRGNGFMTQPTATSWMKRVAFCRLVASGVARFVDRAEIAAGWITAARPNVVGVRCRD